MVGKNNKKVQQEKLAEQTQTYTIKKLSVGVASAIVATGLVFGSVETVSAQADNTVSEEQELDEQSEKARHRSQNDVEETLADAQEVAVVSEGIEVDAEPEAAIANLDSLTGVASITYQENVEFVEAHPSKTVIIEFVDGSKEEVQVLVKEVEEDTEEEEETSVDQASEEESASVEEMTEEPTLQEEESDEPSEDTEPVEEPTSEEEILQSDDGESNAEDIETESSSNAEVDLLSTPSAEETNQDAGIAVAAISDDITLEDSEIQILYGSTVTERQVRESIPEIPTDAVVSIANNSDNHTEDTTLSVTVTYNDGSTDTVTLHVEVIRTDSEGLFVAGPDVEFVEIENGLSDGVDNADDRAQTIDGHVFTDENGRTLTYDPDDDGDGDRNIAHVPVNIQWMDRDGSISPVSQVVTNNLGYYSAKPVSFETIDPITGETLLHEFYYAHPETYDDANDNGWYAGSEVAQYPKVKIWVDDEWLVANNFVTAMDAFNGTFGDIAHNPSGGSPTAFRQDTLSRQIDRANIALTRPQDISHHIEDTSDSNYYDWTDRVVAEDVDPNSNPGTNNHLFKGRIWWEQGVNYGEINNEPLYQPGDGDIPGEGLEVTLTLVTPEDEKYTFVTTANANGVYEFNFNDTTEELYNLPIADSQVSLTVNVPDTIAAWTNYADYPGQLEGYEIDVIERYWNAGSPIVNRPRAFTYDDNVLIDSEWAMNFNIALTPERSIFEIVEFDVESTPATPEDEITLESNGFVPNVGNYEVVWTDSAGNELERQENIIPDESGVLNVDSFVVPSGAPNNEVYTATLYGQDGTAESTASFSVSADRVPPVITPVDNLSVVEDQPIEDIVIETDEPSTFEVTGLPAGLTFDESTNMISGTPAIEDWLTGENSRNFTIGIDATDAAGNTSTETFAINVQRDTDADGTPDVEEDTTAPVITPIENVSVVEDQPIENIVIETDEPSTIEVIGLPEGLIFDEETQSIIGTPVIEDWLAGENSRNFSVRIDAMDEAGNTSTETFVINIQRDTNGNGIPDIEEPEDTMAPEITPIENMTAVENQPITDIVIETDEPSTIEVNNLSEGLAFNQETNTISGAPVVNDWGDTETSRDFVVVVEATDEAENNSLESFVITVQQDSNDDGTPDVEDPIDETAPVITPIENITTVEDQPISDIVISTDDESSTIEVNGLPNGVTFDGENTISGTPVINDWTENETRRNFVVTVEAIDEAQNSSTETFVVSVQRDIEDTEEPEDTTAPTITPIENATATENQPIDSIAVSTDDESSTITVNGLPDGLTFDENTSTINGTPVINDWGDNETRRDHVVTVEATDNVGNVGLETFVLTIDRDMTAPVIESIENVSAVENQPIAPITITTDDESSTIDVSNLPNGLTLDGNTINGLPEINDWSEDETSRDFVVTVEATDEVGNSSFETFVIRVQRDIEDTEEPEDTTAPEIDAIVNVTAVENQPIESIDVSTDDDSSTILVDGLPNGLSFDDSTNLIGGTPVITDWAENEVARNFVVEVIATDEAGNSSLETFGITIQRDLDTEAPVITPIDSFAVDEYESIEDIIVELDEPGEITVEGLPEGITFDEETNTISGSPDINDWSGTEERRGLVVEVTATDEAGNSSLETFTINVRRDTDEDGIPDVDDTDDDNDGYPDDEELEAGSDPKDSNDRPAETINPIPSIETIADQVVSEGEALTPITVTATDDGEVTIDVTNLPEGVQYDPATAEISGTPIVTDWDPTEAERIITVTVTVTDDQDGQVTETFDVTVQRDVDGDGIPDVEDTDDDNDGVNDSDEGAAGLDPKDPDTDGDGTPDGEEDADGDGLTNSEESDEASDSITDEDDDGIADLVDPEDDTDTTAPVISPVEDFNAVENQPINDVVVDVNEESTIDVSGLPDGLTYDEETQIISGTPVIDDWSEAEESRDFTVTIIATDESDNTSDITFDVTVQRDTDGDTIPNVEDTDDDNDGYTDDEELEAGTDPKDDGSIPMTPLEPSQPIDTDGDGISDVEDTDDDNDGVNDSDEDAAGLNPKDPDTDGDGIPDGEEDADDDGLSNSEESDENSDKITDEDDDGIADLVEPENNTDTEAPVISPVEDFVAVENQPIDDVVIDVDEESAIDVSGLPDGLTYDDETQTISGTPEIGDWSEAEESRVFSITVEATDEVSNTSGITFDVTVQRDTDGDTIPGVEDTDDDGDGYTDEEELEAGTNPKDDGSIPMTPLEPSQPIDTDGDGMPDVEDTDDDNDGVNDSDEGEAGLDPKDPDTDGDGISDGDEDADNDGLSNTEESDEDSGSITDKDDDGIADLVDPEDDSDTTAPVISLVEDFVAVENQPIDDVEIEVNEESTVDVSGLPDGLTYDEGTQTISGTPVINDWTEMEESRDFTITAEATDEAGNTSDITFDVTVQRDTDGDIVSDVEDTDDDNDGYTDEEELEAGTDPKDDGSIPMTPLEPSQPTDTDGDGIPDVEDTDDDNDGVNDSDEDAAGLNPKDPDTDGDGIPDGEEDANGDGLTNSEESGEDSDLITDKDDDGIADLVDPEDGADTEAPTLTPIPDISAEENEPIEDIVVETNEPSDIVVDGLPDGITYDRETGTIGGTPVVNDWSEDETEKTYTVTITAEDEADNTSSATFDLDIERELDGLGSMGGLSEVEDGSGGENFELPQTGESQNVSTSLLGAALASAGALLLAWDKKWKKAVEKIKKD